MEKYKIDGCTSTMSSLFLISLSLPKQPLNHPGMYAKFTVSSFATHLTTHSRVHTHSFEIAHSPPTSFNLMPQFFGYYFNVFAHRNGETFWIFSSSSSMCVECSHGVPVFSPFVVIFFCVCIQLLGVFFWRWIGNRSYVFVSSFRSPHSLSNRINFNPLPNNIYNKREIWMGMFFFRFAIIQEAYSFAICLSIE